MKKKVLFLVESLSAGGAEKILTVILKYLDKSSYDVTVCSIVDIGIYVDVVKQYVNYTSIISGDDNSIWYKLKYKMVYHWLPLSLVYRLFVPQKNDIEIAFVEGFATKLLSYSSNEKSRKIAWVHTDLINNHWIESIYDNKEKEKKSYLKFDKVAGVSNIVTQSIVKLYNHKNALTVYNVIDSESILNLSNEKIDIDINHSKIRLITIGRFVPEKAFDRLINIMYCLKKKINNVELYILGDGILRNMYEELIVKFALENDIYLIGFKENPYPYLKYADIFVCSSVVEGYSTAVTEALILGLPVVTTRCSGMDELLKDGKCGMITDNDEEALLKGIELVLSNKDLLKRYKLEVEHRKYDFSTKLLMEKVEHFIFK